jgi:uncharacterized membrane protein
MEMSVAVVERIARSVPITLAVRAARYQAHISKIRSVINVQIYAPPASTVSIAQDVKTVTF